MGTTSSLSLLIFACKRSSARLARFTTERCMFLLRHVMFGVRAVCVHGVFVRYSSVAEKCLAK